MTDQPAGREGDPFYPGGPYPYVPVPIAADPARDARVAARRAEDARKAGAALDRRFGRSRAPGDRGVAYIRGWQDGYRAFAEEYLASALQHNRHYGAPEISRFRTTDHDHELHIRDHDPKPWCEQCAMNDLDPLAHGAGGVPICPCGVPARRGHQCGVALGPVCVCDHPRGGPGRCPVHAAVPPVTS